MLQEWFDRAARGVLAQGKPSMGTFRGRPSCMYRGSDGEKCNFGHLIEDSEYDSNMEGSSAQGITRHFSQLERFMPHIKFLTYLQNAHDYADRTDFIPDYKSRMRDLATKYNLNTSALD